MDKDREMIRIDAKPLALDPIIDQVISKMERMLGGRSYLMQYLGHMMAAAGLTKG